MLVVLMCTGHDDMTSDKMTLRVEVDMMVDDYTKVYISLLIMKMT